MEFEAFARRAAEIEAEAADSAIRERVTDLFHAAVNALPVVARFVQGRVFPAHESTKLDVGPSLCYEAVAKAAGMGVSADDVEQRVADRGDVGAVAESFDFGGQRGLDAFTTGDRSLSVSDVDADLREIADAAGAGSQETKRDLLFGLFNRSEPLEARYLARLVLGEMRIGVGEGTVRDAIAEAFEVPVDAVERALQVSNDYGRVSELAREDGVAGITGLGLEIGRPVKAMLAQAGTVTDAMAEWERAAVEWKYDGARVQVHYDGSSVRLFSRNMEPVTDALPEVVETVERDVDGPAIIDGEVVAVDDDGNPLPFQAILRRFRRKHDVAAAREDVRVRLQAFDCLHADGDDLLNEPLTVRQDRLQQLTDGEDLVSRQWVTADAERIEAIEADALSAGHEGLMLKDPDSAYTPGRRGKQWLKRKPDVETLDLVVTGAEWGEGRRANLFGTFLLSVRTAGATETDVPDQADSDPGYATVGKVATGITDEELADLTALLEPHVRSEDGATVDLAPEVVFEVGYEEIQESPTYGSGYALRFPRFVAVREDKTPAEADTLERVERLVDAQ
jgi:DNA ligase-1